MVIRHVTATVRPLRAAEIAALAPYIPRVDLERVVLHLGHVPWYLPRRFCGIARGRHVYFRRGVYREGTAEGIALLAHELVHVGQYRRGMTAVDYLWSARFGYWNSRHEQAAYALEARVLAELRGRAAAREPAERENHEITGARHDEGGLQSPEIRRPAGDQRNDRTTDDGHTDHP